MSLEYIPKNFCDYEKRKANLFYRITNRNNSVFTFLGWIILILGAILKDWILTAIGWTLMLVSVINIISYLIEYHPQLTKNLKQLKYEIEVANE
jgi:hypothetical protein